MSNKTEVPRLAPAPTSTPTPTPTPTPTLQPTPKASLPSLTGSISIKLGTDVGKADTFDVRTVVADVKPLAQEDLERYWDEASKALGLGEIMSNGKVKLGERRGLIEIDAQTVYFTDEFKAHKIEVMEFLREKTGMRMLDCKVNPLFVSKEEVVYSPDDKYDAMLKKNPGIQGLRNLFPQIDY